MPNKTVRLTDLDAEAAAWVVRLTSGDATASDHAEFEAWRRQSSAHEAALASARRLWVGLGEVMPPPPAAAPVRGGRLAPTIALAASLALCVGLGFQYLKTWRYDHVTAIGQRDVVTLADGSHVQLGSGTAIDVRYAANQRRVRLVRGEAYFDIVHDPRRPFVVDAASGEVRDIGTAFSVRLDGDGVFVVVEHGEVEVASGSSPVTVSANQRVRYRERKVGRVEPANLAEDIAWIRGRLVLEDQPLGAVVAEVNRYYPRTVFLLGSDVGRRTVNAVIDLDHIDDWLDALSQSNGVTVARLPGFVVLY